MIEADICVIGAGSGGLSVASGAAQMGARTVLIERGKMGGDCLNTGCVPSKTLLAAAARAAIVRAGGPGVAGVEPEIDFGAVMARVRAVIASIAPHDSQERFESLGVAVIREEARFTAPDRVRAGDVEIRARRFVIATGSRPVMPPIPGLEDCAPLTNETIFDLEVLPRQLLVLGGGPIGVEMALAFRRLGAEVTLVERETILANEDSDAVAVVRAQLEAEGVILRERAEAVEAQLSGDKGAVMLRLATGEFVAGEHLLVAVGRTPNLSALDLATAGVDSDRRGVTVDARLRSSNRRIYAIGDVAYGPGAGQQFTHVAGYHAGIVIRNALFKWPARASLDAVPRVTYAAPELAQIGDTEAQARATHGEGAKVLAAPFADNDRARAEGEADGFVKVVADRRGRVLGVTIVGAQAGELIQIWALALSAGLRLRHVAGMIAPYPTRGEASKRAAGAFYTPSLFSDRTRWIVRTLFRLFG